MKNLTTTQKLTVDGQFSLLYETKQSLKLTKMD